MIKDTFDATRSFADITLSEELGEAEAISWFRGFVDGLGDAKRVSGLIDTRGLTELNVSADAVRELNEIAEAGEDAFAGSRWAIVANTNIVFGMSRMYQAVRDQAPYEIQVFREMEPARVWLEERAGV